MTEALRLQAGDRVLEIGTGSGYAAAVLAVIAAEVYTIERMESLAALSRRRLRELGYANVQVRHGDGSLGWSEHAPYDAIVVTAGGPEVPHSLLGQLAVGGRLVMPVGSTSRSQRLVRVVRTGEETYDREPLEEVCFVPLIGVEGWPASEERL
jgi:protein-L-isoaspartate(D-aspartate) O-methyltransferase